MTATKVGIKEIAERCGVSKSSVSLVLNNRKGVSDGTRQRIQKAMGELGYRPLRSTRRGVRSRSSNGSRDGVIGFLAFDRWANAGHSYYGPILTGASVHAKGVGYGLTYTQVLDPSQVEPEEVDLASVDGLLITGRPQPGFIELLRARGLPFVVVSPSTPHIDADSVRPENIEGSWIATRHLVLLGHRKIGYLGGEESNTDAQERYFGYRLALQEGGLPVDDDLVTFTDFSPPGGEAGLKQLIERDTGVTAVYAGGDYLALGVYEAAHKAGLSIPHDLSVVGFDDIEPVRYLRPGLTTMQMDLQAIGARSVDRLLQLLDEEQPPVNLRVPSKLLVRDSTAAPPRVNGS